MADILEVNRPTYQMEPDPPRFPLRRLIKYLVWIAIIGTVVTYRAELIKSAREALQEFDKSLPPPREAAPVAVPSADPSTSGPRPGEPEATAPASTPPALPAPPPYVPAAPAPAKPESDPAKWITTDDYPSAALREGREGLTKFRVIVSPRGAVADCQIVSSSGSPDLDHATCAAIRQRARFMPAIDAEGRPAPGIWSNRVRWTIPE